MLFVAARGDERNRGLVGATLLDALPAGAFLINVARGSLLDEPALIARLRDGRLGGAGLDVFQQEPTDPELWAGVPNTVLTPHLGGYASAAMRAMIDLAVSNLDRYFAGQPLAAVSRLA